MRKAPPAARNCARRGGTPRCRCESRPRAFRQAGQEPEYRQAREAACRARAARAPLERSRRPGGDQPPAPRGFLPMRLMVFLGMFLGLVAAHAQTFPTRALRVIVPQPPGGGFDMVARTLSEPFATLLGQPVIVENRPGGGTVVGTEVVAKADADGYTVLLGASANLVLSAGLYSKLPYNPKTDFTPVGIAATFSYTLVARNDLPFSSLREIVDHARTNPGKLTYASGGNGSGQHIAAAVTFHLAGVNITHVPYKGAQAAYQDLIPGRVDMFFDNSATARAHIQNGRVKPIAVSAPQRISYHPDVPTVREAGV